MMEDISESRAVRLSWDKVCGIVSKEIEEILGVRIQCRINVAASSFWDLTFINYRLPLPNALSTAARNSSHLRGLGD